MGSLGEASDVGVPRTGVPGTDGWAEVAEPGTGREGSEHGGAMGRVIERRLVFREATDVDRDDRVGLSSDGVGGGAISPLESIDEGLVDEYEGNEATLLL